MSHIPSPALSVPALLPLLFSPDPTPLPKALLSPTTHLTHTYLSTSPSSPSYLQLVPSLTLTLLHSQAVERGIEDLRIGPAQWSIEDGAVRGRVPISPAGSSSSETLAIELVWEEGSREGDEAGPRWLFVTLALVGKDAAGWYPSLEAALAAVELKKEYEQPLSLSRDNFLESHGEEEEGEGRWGRPGPIDMARAKKEKTAEMAEGEGTTPGAYGAASDFWDGWSDAGDSSNHSAEASSDDGHAAAARFREAEQHDEEEREDYWERYGGVESVVGETDSHHHDHHEPEPAPSRPRSVTRSRRSSTIRAPPGGIATPPLFGSPALTSNPASSLVFGASAAAKAATNGHSFHPAGPTSADLTPVQSSIPPLPPKDAVGKEDDEDALRFALAGVWALYAKGSTWDERERKRDVWDRMTRIVPRS